MGVRVRTGEAAWTLLPTLSPVERERERERAILAQVGVRWGVNLDCDSRGAFLPFPAVLEHHVRSCVCLNGPRVLSLCPTPDHGPFRGWLSVGGKAILHR